MAWLCSAVSYCVGRRGQQRSKKYSVSRANIFMVFGKDVGHTLLGGPPLLEATSGSCGSRRYASRFLLRHRQSEKLQVAARCTVTLNMIAAFVVKRYDP